MAKNEVFKRLIDEVKYSSKLNQAEISEKLGVKSTYLSDMINGRVPMSSNMIDKIHELFHINTSMLSKDHTPQASSTGTTHIISTGKVIPFYDAEVAAGTSYEMEMTPTRSSGTIEIGGLMKDSEFALRVYGNSMTPNYPSGCVIGLKPHMDSFIEPGTVFVIETTDNRYLKRLYYTKERDAFRCISDNHMKHDSGPMSGEFFYAEFEIPLAEVRRLLRVTGVIKRNIL